MADTYTLYLKTHNYHWNITGPMFNTLHLMFENQYNELALAVDLIAERIRALGCSAPGSYAQFAKLSVIKETDGVPSAEEMIANLVKGQDAVAKTARSVFPPRKKSATNQQSRSAHSAHERPREDSMDAPRPAAIIPPNEPTNWHMSTR